MLHGYVGVMISCFPVVFRLGTVTVWPVIGSLGGATVHPILYPKADSKQSLGE